MSITNHERITKNMNLLRDGLRPFVERELNAKYGKYWVTKVSENWQHDLNWQEGADLPEMDAAFLLRAMWEQWNEVFRATLGFSERSFVSELREVRNKWAHQSAFSTDDTYRALDSAARLLAAISAPQADEIEKNKLELLRLRFDEQIRTEKRKTAGIPIESPAAAGLKAWREIVTPHPDVASGRYQQAEFAADLWQVHLGEGTDEYRHPVEFFRRTYLTESLKTMLANAVRRLSGQGGDPVVQLQTNFGGGKTHAMLALYHLFGGVNPLELPGIDTILTAAGGSQLPHVTRVVLVGNKISPGNPSTKPDGTIVRTLWGELAWQLGGKPAFNRIQADDARATNPGDVLRELFVEYGPCLILIDEWVAYARQLHDQSDFAAAQGSGLPAGGFETQFTFAQALTESARLAKNCLLVISLPASDTSGSPHTQADDVEVGGQRGREALDRLRNIVGRVESSWRPATAEEGFEIVRRRLFEPLSDPNQFKDRDVIARAFSDLYRAHPAEFPPECREAGYETRIKAAYPIHPEIFDRLYTDWSTLVKFQRTRGVLRLMAAVIHCLWEKGDRNPIILPANLPLDDSRVQFELTRYLSDHWTPIIEKDVDGAASLPMRIDGDVSTLGKFAATRRVARTIYLGSAPLTQASHRGLEDRRVKLGCVMPGESPTIFGDALRRLAGAATYLYQDGTRYWYSTQPTVTKLAEDRAEQLKREPDKIVIELEKRLRADTTQKGDFVRIHALPQSSHDVSDEYDARLVVLRAEHAYDKQTGNKAETAAEAILKMRGNQPRIFQNTLVFLAADKTRLQDLDEAIRKYLAWESILNEQKTLDLSPLQVKQAETQKASAEGMVVARLPETYQWLLVPVQPTPQVPITWQAQRLTGSEALAVRASKRLKNDELLLTEFAGTRLRMEMDRVPLWRGEHVSIRQLAEDFARYIYLPRLKNSDVLLSAIRDGVQLLTWQQDSFAFADRFDEVANRYQGLRAGQSIQVFDATSTGLLVRSATAARQIQAESAAHTPNVPPPTSVHAPTTIQPHLSSPPAQHYQPQPQSAQPTRFHASVTLNTLRVGADASRIAEEVIAHLSSLVGAEVTVLLDIEVRVPGGVPETIVRIVTENSRTLKFDHHAFEQD